MVIPKIRCCNGGLAFRIVSLCQNRGRSQRNARSAADGALAIHQDVREVEPPCYTSASLGASRARVMQDKNTYLALAMFRGFQIAGRLLSIKPQRRVLVVPTSIRRLRALKEFPAKVGLEEMSSRRKVVPRARMENRTFPDIFSWPKLDLLI